MKRLRIGGHPVHPLTVHLPFGVLATVPLLDAATAWGVAWTAQVAWWALALGLSAGTVAGTAGLLDYLAIPKGHSSGWMADIHLGLMASSLSAFTISLLLRAGSPGAAAGVGALGLVLLLAGGWAGGELVYGHGVGLRGSSGDDPP